MKLSFKKHPKQTGLMRIGNSWQGSDIKANGKRCGTIYPKTWREEHYRVSFMVKKERTKEAPAPFRNVTLNFKCDTDAEARAWIKENWQLIIAKYDLYFMEN